MSTGVLEYVLGCLKEMSMYTRKVFCLPEATPRLGSKLHSVSSCRAQIREGVVSGDEACLRGSGRNCRTDGSLPSRCCPTANAGMNPESIQGSIDETRKQCTIVSRTQGGFQALHCGLP